MSKINIIFTLKEVQKTISCDRESNLREPAKKFALSIQKKITDFYFVYELKKININTKIKEINNEKDEIEIIANEKERNDEDDNIIYKVSGKTEKIQIFGEIFVKNNQNNFKIIIENYKEIELTSLYDLKKYSGSITKNKTIVIKLKQIKEVTDLSMMFQGCRDLICLPDLSKLNLDNVTDISYLFSNCSSLSSLPDISSWNTSKIKNMSSLFYGCSSLESLPDISYWDTSNVIDMSFLFYNCSGLKTLPDISKWDTKEVIDMSYMLYSCSKLELIPDISKWNILNLLKMTNMLSNCSSLKNYPDISKWNNQILINNERINSTEKNIEEDDVSLQMTNDHYFLSCKNCKTIPEIILKDDESLLLKCNKCGISECESVDKICNYTSLWVNEIIHYCSNYKHEEKKISRKYCKTCELFLCFECLKNHMENKHNHEYLEIKDLDFNFCNNHKQLITQYCKTCDKGFCIKCNYEHYGHEIKNINEVNSEDEEIEIKDKDKESIKKSKIEEETKKENENNPEDKKEEKEEKDDNKSVHKDNSDEIIDINGNEEEKKNNDNNENNDNNSEKEGDKDDKKDENEKEKKINNRLLNLNIFERFLKKTKESIDEKDKIIKEIISFLDILKEQDESLQKAFSKKELDFNILLHKDQNFLNLSKILFISAKKNNESNENRQNNQNSQNIDKNENYKGVINILKNKFTNEEMDKFKEYIHSQREEFILATQKLTQNEKETLKRNINFQFKPPNRNISDTEKTKKFISRNIESTKIMKKHMIIERVKNPDNYINVENTINNPANMVKPLNSRQNAGIVLSLFGKSIKNNGIEVLVAKTKDKQFKNMEIASVNSLITLGNKKSYELFYDYGEERNKKIINDEIEKEKLMNNFKLELAKRLNIGKEEIILFIEPYDDIYEKKILLKFSFSIPTQTKDFTEELNKFANENNNIVKLNKKQILDAIQISPELLDPNGDKYENWCRNKIRGGERYFPPTKDWYGIGLNVKDKYENNDWLDNKNKKGEYAIAYLGLNTFLKDKEQILKDAKKYTDQISNMISNKLYEYEPNIKVKGFCCEKCGPKCGEGVCLFQNIEYAENNAGILEISGFKIKIIFMCRVNPIKIRQPKRFPQCWILNPTADEIRPYRILIKKIPCSSLHENVITTISSPVDYITSAIESNDISFLSKKNDIQFDEYAKIGSQNINDDFFVIRLYSSDYYKYINNYLRNENYFINNEDSEFTEKDIISWIFCLQSALTRNINVDDDITVYRGIRKVKFSSEIGIGSKFYFREFVSTSIKRNVAEDFLQGEGTLLIIKIKNNGTNGFPNYCYYIEDITYYTGEYEVLLCSHCYFSVTNIQHRKDIDYVFLTCEGYLLNNINYKKKIKPLSLSLK